MHTPFEETHLTWYAVAGSVAQRAELLEGPCSLQRKRQKEETGPKVAQELTLGLRGGSAPEQSPQPKDDVKKDTAPRSPGLRNISEHNEVSSSSLNARISLTPQVKPSKSEKSPVKEGKDGIELKEPIVHTMPSEGTIGSEASAPTTPESNPIQLRDRPLLFEPGPHRKADPMPLPVMHYPNTLSPSVPLSSEPPNSITRTAANSLEIELLPMEPVTSPGPTNTMATQKTPAAQYQQPSANQQQNPPMVDGSDSFSFIPSEERIRRQQEGRPYPGYQEQLALPPFQSYQVVHTGQGPNVVTGRRQKQGQTWWHVWIVNPVKRGWRWLRIKMQRKKTPPGHAPPILTNPDQQPPRPRATATIVPVTVLGN